MTVALAVSASCVIWLRQRMRGRRPDGETHAHPASAETALPIPPAHTGS